MHGDTITKVSIKIMLFSLLAVKMLSRFVQSISADFVQRFGSISLFFATMPSHLDGKQISRRLPNAAELKPILVVSFVPIFFWTGFPRLPVVRNQIIHTS